MPKQVAIENPIINSPFEESRPHYRFDDDRYGHGRENPPNLIVEVRGERDAEKAAKVAAARNRWVPAVKKAPAWERWAFAEISDPWDAKNTIRAQLNRSGSAKT
jgi:type III restriction enzyme